MTNVNQPEKVARQNGGNSMQISQMQRIMGDCHFTFGFGKTS